MWLRLRLLVALLAAAAAVAALPSELAMAPLHYELDPDDQWVVIFNRTAEMCEETDGTDSMPIAWYSKAANSTFLIASVSNGVRPNIGHGPGGLDHLEHDCSRLVFNSTFDLNPEAFANHQWLQSVHVFNENNTAAAIIHNEFHGFLQEPEYCTLNRSSFGSHCNMWSSGLGISTDGAQTFRVLGTPPRNRVASEPFVYRPDRPTFGYGAISQFLQGADGAYYGFIHVLSTQPEQPSGHCPIRTTNLFDTAAFRAWGGEGFNVSLVDPYTVTDPSRHICTPLAGPPNATSSHPSPRRFVWGGGGSAGRGDGGGPRPRSDLPGFVMFGDGNGREATVHYRFASGSDFARAVTGFGPPQELRTGLERYLPARSSLIYPTILDHNSVALGSDSFDVASNESTFLYVNIERNIWRRRVVLLEGPPPPPPAPPAPNRANCSALSVSGAGMPSVDGTRYLRLPDRTSDGLPVYRMGNVSVYRFQGVWRIAVETVQVFYEALDVNSTPVPAAGWRIAGGLAPAPERVICTA